MNTMKEVFEGHEKRMAELAQSDNPLAKGVVFVDGEFVPVEEARIPFLDQGFLRSDLTYDVPAVWDGRFFRLDDHLDRFQSACDKLRLRIPMERDEMRSKIVEMVKRSGIRDAYVEVIVTRGNSFVREYKTSPCNLYLMAIPYVWIMRPEVQQVGGTAVVARSVRRVPPGAMDPTVKNLQWGDFVYGLFEAMDRDAQYPILTDGDCNVTEGPGFNVFAVKNNTIYTPSRGVLEGVTRRTVLELAQKKGWQTAVEHVPVDLLYDCDELFFCSTAGGIMPVTSLDHKPIGNGKIGPITNELWESYWAAHYDDSYSFPIDYN